MTTRSMRSLLCIWLAGTACAVGQRAGRSEEFLLQQGGRIRGQWLNREDAGSDVYAIELERGGEVRLPRSSVTQVLQQSAAEQKYDTIRSEFPDDVQGQWELSEWCAAHGLDGQREVHLRRLLALDPNHTPARKLLGYRLVHGEWMTREDEMAERGMILYQGHYRTAQYIELDKRREEQRRAEADWVRKVRRWCGWLTGGRNRRAPDGEKNLRSIRDPLAVDALTRQLHDHAHPEIRLLLVDVLARIAREALQGRASGAWPAVSVLVEQSLSDPDREVRLTCIDHLVDLNHPAAVRPYVEALSSGENVRINRAAIALKALKSFEAISPLIDAVVTTHTVELTGRGPGQTSATFSPDGGGGIGVGGGPQRIRRSVRNAEVLSALVAISGENFNYDTQAWRAWHAARQRATAFNARRD